MEFINFFKAYLDRKKITNKTTVKNYLSDIRYFLNWYERSFGIPFRPLAMSVDLIKLYEGSRGARIINGNIKEEEKMSQASMKRRISSLRLFTKFLTESNYIGQNPFVWISENSSASQGIDKWHTQEFKDYLKSKKVSDLTIKNYITDIHSFRRWYEKSVEPYIEKTTFPLINDQVVTEYKKRLVEYSESSPRTINRKLSSLRKYVEFALASNYLDEDKFYDRPITTNMPLNENEAENQENITLNAIERHKINPNYSSIPPVRLFQKLIILPYLLIEAYIAAKLFSLLYGGKAAASAAKKVSPAASALNLPKKASDLLSVKGYKKQFFAPKDPSPGSLPLHRKLWHHARHTRPEWYKRYHKITIVHYINFAVLIIFAAGVSVSMYRNFTAGTGESLYAATNSPYRTLSFEGRLTDNTNSPITESTDVRFSLYNDVSASGSALLWQESHYATPPDESGLFKVTLGNKNSIPEEIFKQNERIYLGITVENTPELKPRRRIASTSYAANSKNLQGMMPITDSSAGTSNVILALDSSGNLSIGDDASPSFTATGGQFTLAGEVLMLSTVTGTDSNVVISPDGLGKIDVQKPLVNTAATGNIAPGGVQINDKVGVLATESAVASFIINNDGGSDLFTASSSGATRFRIANDGTLTIPSYNTGGGVFYANGSGSVNQTTVGLNGNCLKSTGGNAPTWGSCGNGGAFEVEDGITFQKNTTTDFLIGGNSTDSAKFSVLNVNRSSTPIASISAITTAKALSLSGDGTIQTARNNNLQIGGNRTGNILLMPLNEKGRVGVNTNQPNATFDIKSTEGTIPGARITSNTIADALRIINEGDGNLISAYVSGDTKFEVRNNGDVVADGTITGSGSDFAEYFKKSDQDEVFEPGQLVCIGNSGVTKCNNSSNDILGIVSDNAGFVGGGDRKNDPKYVLVGLVGQLRAKVKGEVKTGDPLTVSSTTGTAKKADQEGMIIGYAMEDKNGQQRIITSIQPKHYKPTLTASALNNFTIGLENGSYVLRNTAGNTVNNIGAFSNLAASNIRAGIISTQKITANSLSSAAGTINKLTADTIRATTGAFNNVSASSANITSAAFNSISIGSENVVIAGTNIRDYIAGIVEETINSQFSTFSSEEIISPVASIDNISTDVISPLTGDSIEIESNATVSGNLAAETISGDEATISGNLNAKDATISGSLASDTLQTRDATISGTLDLSDEAIARLREDLERDNSSSTDSSDTIQSSDSADTELASSDLNDENESTSSVATNYNLQSTNNEIETGNIYADFGLYSESLTVLGSTTTTQMTAMDSISVGTGFTLDENSINTLNETLEIQPLRQADISFMAGKVKIDTDGNIDINGNLDIAGNIKSAEGVFEGIRTNNLATNIISPLPDSDLVIRLGNNDNASDSGDLRFENSEGEEIARISGEGDITSSGSATFDKLNFNLVGEALAESATTATSTGSAGFATLNRNRQEITIYNDNVTKDSLIYITPFGDTQDKILHLLRQTPHEEGENGTQGSFTVGVSGTPASKNIEFNWLIVN